MLDHEISRFTALRAQLIRKAMLAVLVGLTGVAAAAQTAATPVQPVATAGDAVSAAVGTPAAQDTRPAAKPSATAVSAKGKQAPYTGPTTIIVLPGAPMLDEESKQRIDPDGNLMFYPPTKQIRDKKGHPVFDSAGKPVFQTASNLGYDEHGKKIIAVKVKPPKVTPVSISAGTLTVDGWTGKARLWYDIADLKYMYIYAPAIGTTIVSEYEFPGAKEQLGAFNGKTLRITVEGHPIELYSEKPLLGKKPHEAWVAVDRDFMLPSKFPVFGYGARTRSPYEWPGAKESVATKAPPLPEDLLPTLQLAPCPAGMMRVAGPTVLPGQKAPERPCVPINTSSATTNSHGSQTQ